MRQESLAELRVCLNCRLRILPGEEYRTSWKVLPSADGTAIESSVEGFFHFPFCK